MVAIKIILGILIFSVIIIIHELGHFLLAKANGICVQEFCLGLGPTLFGFTKGETKYSLKLLPFGGACMMLGEDEEDGDERAFCNKSVWARMSVVLAGPVFNFILAFIISLIMVGGRGYDLPVVGGLVEGFPAEEAGIEVGDTIISLNDKSVTIYRDITMFNQFNRDDTVKVVYEHNGERKEATLERKADDEGNLIMGITNGGARTKGGFFETVRYSFSEVRFWIELTYKSLGAMITGNVSLNDMSGPVGIVSVIGDTYDAAKPSGAFALIMSLLNIANLLTANLGVMNLLPIPALDGGRFVLLVFEAIRHKKFDQKKEGMVNFVFFVLLLLLMAVVMINDIRKLII